MTISINRLRRVNLGRNEESGKNRHRPPPHPPLIDSYFVIKDKFILVVTTSFNTHLCCKTHAYHNMSYHNVKLVSNYKTTVYERWVWWGTVADRPPIFRSFQG